MSPLSFLPRGVVAAFGSIAITAVLRADAAPAAPASAPLHANVMSIEDNRSSGGFGSACRLTLTFMGDEIADSRGVLDVRATKAVDELDRDLVGQESGSEHFRPFGLMSARWRSGHGQPTGVLTLRNPSRRAATIKVEGVVDLFRPTESNDGIVTMPDGLVHRDRPIENATLKKYGIEVTSLSEQKAAELRRTLPAIVDRVVANPTSEDEHRRLEAVAAEVARRRALREAGAQQLEGQVESAGEPGAATLPPSSAHVVTRESPAVAAVSGSRESISISFQIKDPQHKLVDLECCDHDGHPLTSASFSVFGTISTMRFTAPPPADAKLVAYIASPGAVESHPFKIESIALP